MIAQGQALYSAVEQPGSFPEYADAPPETGE